MPEDNPLDLLDRHGRYDRHSTDQTAQSQVGPTVGMEKLERVFGLSSASLNRISIQHLADIRLGNQIHVQANIRPNGWITLFEVRKFVEDVSIENNKIEPGVRGLLDN
jgi:hypothetical protein